MAYYPITKGEVSGKCNSSPFHMDAQKLDYIKFFKEEGDEGFSPERNKQIVEDSIKNYEKERARRVRDFTDDLGERSHAVTSYLMHLQKGNKSTPLEKYFGKAYLAQLQGRKIVEKIKFIKNKDSFYKPEDRLITLSSIN